MEKGTYRSISGNVATAWGLCAASEKSGLPLFCGSYPIDPATVILEELAKRKDLGGKPYRPKTKSRVSVRPSVLRSPVTSP